MPISLEAFRSLKSVPAGEASKGKFQRKCDWDRVLVELGGQAWTVKEAHGVASKHVGKDQSISRVRTKRFLDKLVEKKLAASTYDGLSYIYYVNPPKSTPKPVQK